MIKTNEGMQPAEGAWFVIPADHHEDYSTLGFDFLKEVTEHKEFLGENIDNEGFNMSTKGGKIIAHMHYWLMQAQPDDMPLGLYSLRAELRN